MSFISLPKGSALLIKAKDPLAITIGATNTCSYNGSTLTVPGQLYNTNTATLNGLALSDKDNLVWRRVSEHNRSEFSIGNNRIEQQQRMANGTMRKYFIADKKTFNVSWQMLPSFRNETVDGAWGAEDLKTFYEGLSGQGAFEIKVKTNTEITYNVIFTGCDFAVIKRGIQPYWSVNLSMEQV